MVRFHFPHTCQIMRMRSAKFANKITSNIPFITQIERGTRGNIVLHNSKEERLSPLLGDLEGEVRLL